jgi:peptide/nickel transport system substrate-binding protein
MTTPQENEMERSAFTFMQRPVTRRNFLAGGAAAGGMLAAHPLLTKSESLLHNGVAASTRSSGGVKVLTAVTSSVASGFDRDGPNTDPGFGEANYNCFYPLIHYPQPLSKGAYVPNFSAKANQFVPVLAESWQSEGPLRWVMKLRKGVYSAAGNEFNSADVVYTFARAKSISGSASNSWFLSNVAGILSFAPVLPGAKPSDKKLHGEVVALDRYTVQFNLFEPSGLFFFMALTDINLSPFDSVEMKKHATAADPWSHTWGNANAAGYGPYHVTSWNPGVELIYQATPNWFQGKPEYGTVVTTAVAEGGSRLAALEAGDAQIASYLEPPELAKLKTNSNVSLIGAYTNQINFMCLSYNYAPWNLPKNQLLRQAVAYSIPYDNIVKLNYLGFGRRMYSQIPSSFAGYKQIKTYSTNLSKARSLLAQAGFPGGSGLSQYSSGLQMYFVSERSTLLEPIANQIRTNLASIGINVTLQPLPQAEFATKQLQTHDLPMSIFDFSSPSVPDAGFVCQLLYQSQKAGGLVDPTNFANATFDKLSGQAKSASGAKRTALLHQMQDILMSQLPTIPLVEALPVEAMRKPISGWFVPTEATVPLYAYVKS